MLRNYLRIAFRNLQKYKSFSIINIFGLTLGTACCLYILLYVKDEYNYDRHHEDVDQIFRVATDVGKPGDLLKLASCSPPIPGTMKRDFAEIEEATRFVVMFTDNRKVFRVDDKVHYETDGVYADSSFFNVFTYDFIYGSPHRALANPYDVVLSEQTALSFFGDVDPVGKTFEMDTDEGRQNLKVTGVFSKNLGKSHIQANYFLAMDSGGAGSFAVISQEWVGNNFTHSYVKLSPNASAASLEAKLPEFMDRYAGESLKDQEVQKILSLQPIASIHTTPGRVAEPGNPVSPMLLFILLGIAGLIQLIACINFMNLSTARATRRTKEIGIRKVIGAQRESIIWQFLSESVIFAFFAVFIAVPLITFLLPTLNQLTGVELSANFLMDQRVWLGIVLFGLFTGLLAGSYPAFYLSNFRPLEVLKNTTRHLGGHVNLRQALVVFQFVLTIALISCVIIIQEQLRFIQQQELGYDPDQKIVLTFRTNDALRQAEAYRDAIQRIPGVEQVSRANNYPSQFVFNDLTLYEKGASVKEAKMVKFMRVDEYFVNTLGMELLQGRDLKQVDTLGGVLVNQALLRAFDIPETEAVGQRVLNGTQDYIEEMEIVGVIRDFNFNSLYNEVTPFMLVYDDRESNAQMIIRSETSDYSQLLGQLQRTWESQIPFVPFEYTFIDEAVQRQYEGDRRLSSILNSFTFLTILISCLGLLGLAAFTAERRTKEIGIRKVLGASVVGITAMISKEFLKLVLIAIVLSVPLAWWAMSNWLENFAYRVEIQWWMFVLAGLSAIVVAMLTVGYQSMKAALADPVWALRNE